VLADAGEQVLDLEAIAGHKGSVYGGLGMPVQPTNEQFENDLVYHLEQFDPFRIIWIEDESRMIGTVSIPDSLFDRMNLAMMIRLDGNRESRIRRLVMEYSVFGADALKEKTARIAEKLGGTCMKAINEALDRGEYATVAGLVLDYYDKAYEHSVARRKGRDIFPLPLSGDDPAINSMILLGYLESMLPSQMMPYGTSLS
jgi:tRNA 2-selenouridine synthase